MGVFQEEKSLDELQEENERQSLRYSIEQKRAMIKKIERERGPGAWKYFSKNGTKGGIDWERLRFQQ